VVARPAQERERAAGRRGGADAERDPRPGRVRPRLGRLAVGGLPPAPARRGPRGLRLLERPQLLFGARAPRGVGAGLLEVARVRRDRGVALAERLVAARDVVEQVGLGIELVGLGEPLERLAVVARLEERRALGVQPRDLLLPRGVVVGLVGERAGRERDGGERDGRAGREGGQGRSRALHGRLEAI
jgi:hypothetical protein